ncbi:MAG TPA: FAD-dependent oxidoreductase, partial [Oscillospiraceae bacterium]|nr:FAD-dependent oxidoreductase [Oscillospiraceae bacterium]
MKKLHTPTAIGTVELRNRLVMAPMVDGFSAGGVPTQRSLDFFRVRAAGGVGLIVVGNIHVDPTHRHVLPECNLYEDSFVEKIRPLVEVIHAGGAKTFAQLIHQGRYARSSEYIGGVQAVAPSAVFTRFTGETPRELSVEEIGDLVGYYAAAAGRAVRAGFDGIEICANSGYLPGQFLSPLTNLRTDRYGGTPEARMTFLKEVIAAVRGQVGDRVPITVRMGGSDFVPGSNTNEDACRIAAELEKAGVNAISVTGGWHESGVPQVTMDLPHGVFGYLGANIKRAVNIPVIMSNRMNIETAEALVERGDADLIAMARPMLADPDAPAKAARGCYDEIRPCIGCNQGCLDNSMSGNSIACLANAECGREYELKDVEGRLPTQCQAPVPKRILVVGAGVAGMEFARVAALRGHRVTVWESAAHSGGQMDVTSAPPGRHDFRYLADYLFAACGKAGVTFVFGKTASAGEIREAMRAGQFDRVVVATGAQPITPNIPTEEGASVVQAWDVLRGRVETGREVVVVGGGAVGVETAIFLGTIGTVTPEALAFLLRYRAETPETLRGMLNRGSKKVTVVEMLKSAGKDIGKTTRWIMMGRLKELGVTIHTLTRVVEIKKEGVVVEGPEGTQLLPADTAVLAIGSRSNRALYEALGDSPGNISIVGDAEKPRKAMD